MSPQDAVRIKRVQRLERDREQLAQLAAGGAPDRPIEVVSAAAIEARIAAAMTCPQCGGEYRIVEHVVAPGGRKVDVACRQCGTPRALWFRIVDAPPADN